MSERAQRIINDALQARAVQSNNSAFIVHY